MQINITRNDFNRLKKIREINQKYFTSSRGYSSIARKEEVKKLQRPVRTKIEKLKNKLIDQSYFSKRFDITISMPNKQTNQFLMGEYRDQIWISMVDIVELSKMQNWKYKRVFLPQLQIALQHNQFIISSIWIEGNAQNQKYKERLFEYLEKNSIDEKYELVFFNKEDDKFVFEGNYNRLSDEEKEFYNENSKFSMGVRHRLTINKLTGLGENVTSFVIRELQVLNEKIFSTCFNYSVGRKVRKAIENEKARRKSRGKFEIIESVRKGTGEQKITYRHRQIQNDLFDYFNDKYEGSGIATELENDFVDIKLEFTGSNSVNLYEIKTNDSAIKCIKAGLGQLLFYNLMNREKGWKNIELVIVGLHKMTREAKNFVKSIKEYLGKENFRYQVFNETKKILLSESKS